MCSKVLSFVIKIRKWSTHKKKKPTYKLSTATSVTSFIDTFFCSIIWTISPVGKCTTFYFQRKAKCACCASFKRPPSQRLLCLQSHRQLLLESLPSSNWEAWQPSAPSKLRIMLSLAFLLDKVLKTFQCCRGKSRMRSLAIKPKEQSHTKKPLVPRIWNVTELPVAIK